MKTSIKLSIILFFLIAFGSTGCTQNTTAKGNNNNQPKSTEVKYKVTFIELGSVRCIPCQKMQPIMKSVEEKFAGQVQVIFYDVWTADGKPYAQKYRIRAIPTQVFLDESGKEYFRHVGFFPENKLIKILKQKGVN